MSTPHAERIATVEATMAFVRAFESWVRRTATAKTGESVPRLQLLYELHCEGPRRMNELADSLGVTPRAITALVDALEEDDLVRRTAHPTDRRVTMVEITGGAAKVEEQFGAFQSAVTDLFADLGDGDAAAMRRAFDVIQSRIAGKPATEVAADAPPPKL